MKSASQSSGFEIERLEQRRLLCAGLSGAAGGHTLGVVEASHVVNAPAAPATNYAGADVLAAFAQSNGGMRGGELVWGETTVIDGSGVATWAIISKKTGVVMAAGATIPLGLAENQPQQGGSGPAGAIASLKFPAAVQSSTYFNHLELHTQPNGHPISPAAANPNRYRPAHFDFHFYGIPEEQVRAILPGPPIAQVPPDRLPAGYAQPGPSEPQMGRHAGPASELTETGPFSAVMIAGFTPNAEQMHFLEPMVTRETLLRQENFTLPVPMPQEFDRDTRYPTTFKVVFKGGAHHFIFSDFINTNAGNAETTADATPVRSGLHVQRTAPAVSLFSMSTRHADGGEDDMIADDEGNLPDSLR
ncbi:MAG TPA: hypothetical protein VGR35_12895 [Tepidisphaeraceae bacterium]|nr:hypothetical protein [Tepidisphaeraceae bacterium]